MRRYSSTTVAAFLAVTFFCGSGAVAAGALPPPVPPLPSSMLAIGDSFTIGFASGAPGCPVGSTPCPAVSWSTGGETNSHFARILAGNPAIDGQQRNVAAPGTTMSGFAGQVASGIVGGAPDYVTVMLGAGDVCFGGPTPVSTFTTSFRAGMDALAAANPSMKVLVASIWNFESLRQAVLSRDPSAVWLLCGDILSAANPISEAVMVRIDEYNAALEAACGDYSICRFDGGAFFDHVWSSDEVSLVDNLHPSAAGQESLSRLLWAAGYWAPVDDPILEPAPEPAPELPTPQRRSDPVPAIPTFTG
jgi:lysophospholipase L1-like esterase